MRFPNETLYFVVRFKATANRWRTSSELIPRDNQSDTNPSKFRLLFAQLAQALLFTLRNEGLCQGRPHRNPTVSTHLNSQTLVLFPHEFVLFFTGTTVPDFKEPPMEWITPQHEEIDLNCEISSYANAEL